jgi:hypothetical protein
LAKILPAWQTDIFNKDQANSVPVALCCVDQSTLYNLLASLFSGKNQFIAKFYLFE